MATVVPVRIYLVLAAGHTPYQQNLYQFNNPVFNPPASVGAGGPHGSVVQMAEPRGSITLGMLVRIRPDPPPRFHCGGIWDFSANRWATTDVVPVLSSESVQVKILPVFQVEDLLRE